jgi:hypothetical protein
MIPFLMFKLESSSSETISTNIKSGDEEVNSKDILLFNHLTFLSPT